MVDASLMPLLDAIAPERCGACGGPAPALCECCLELIERIGTPQSTPVPWPSGGGRLEAGFWYEPPLRQLIQAGKYRGHGRALRLAAVLASERLPAVSPAAPLVPMPLGRVRLRFRGYNQAEIIARALERGREGPVVTGLARVRETASQVGRHRGARTANVAGAFAWTGAPLVGAAVRLVDDVVTTGATAEAATAALMAAGAGRVDVTALARA